MLIINRIVLYPSVHKRTVVRLEAYLCSQTPQVRFSMKCLFSFGSFSAGVSEAVAISCHAAVRVFM